ncbi:MAG: RNA methyltransferase substrate-binding domain-containing protein, partial [bacterium]
MTETIYGRNAVYESVRAQRRTFHQLTMAEGIRKSPVIERILALAEELAIPVEWTGRDDLD